MRKLLPFVALATLFFVSCKQSPKTAEDVAKAFSESLNKFDIEGAKKLATKESDSMFGMMAMIANDPETKAKAAKAKPIEKVTCEGDDSKKKCKVCCDADGKESTLTLVKENDAWKVNFSKSAMMEEGLKDAGEGLGNSIDSLDNVMDESLKELDKATESIKTEEEGH